MIDDDDDDDDAEAERRHKDDDSFDIASLHDSDNNDVCETMLMVLVTTCPPLTSTWPHQNSDVGLEKGEY